MSGVCIEKLPHDCGASKALQVFADTETGKITGYCFSCGKYVANPYGKEVSIDEVELPKPKTPEEIQAEIAEVSTYDVVDLPHRKLRADDLKAFDIKVAFSEEDGKTPEATYFPQTRDGKLVGYYVKTLSDPSYTYSIGDVKGADLFGWDKALKSGAYRLIITEGPEDAAAVRKIYKTMLKPTEQEWMPAVVSLPNGVRSVGVLARLSDAITRNFKEVVLSFDDDKPGHKAVEEALVILPKALSVTLPYKDANDCIIQGAMKEAYKAFRFEASKPKNTRIINGWDLHMIAREPTPYGELTWPYPTMQKLLRGVRYGETIYIGAGVKMGKSELLNDIASHFIKEHDVPVFMAKPEEVNKKTYKMMANKMVGSVFTDPDVPFDYELYDKAGKMMRDRLFMIDMYQHIGWDSLRQDIVAAASMGCKVIFIDPITNLTAGIDSGDANTLLQDIAQGLSSLAMDLGIVIFIFCHLKAPEGNLSKDSRAMKYNKGQYYNLGNCPHERGGDILSNQFYGSRAMMQKCNLMLGLAGNKDPDLPEEIQRMRWLCINEDREFGNSANVPLIFNPKTTLYKEVM